MPFLRGDHRSSRRPSSSPFHLSRQLFPLPLIRIAKVSEEGRGGRGESGGNVGQGCPLPGPLARSTQWGEMDGNGEEEGGGEGGGGVDIGVANGRRQRGKCGGWKLPDSVVGDGGIKSRSRHISNQELILLAVKG